MSLFLLGKKGKLQAVTSLVLPTHRSHMSRLNSSNYSDMEQKCRFGGTK